VITLNFLWHFHQPDYRHPASGEPILPWVRLHSVKGYLDLLTALEANPAARVTVNWSGVLLDQLNAYVDGKLLDYWGQLSQRPAADLDSTDRQIVLENFFSANAQTLIRPHARYSELQRRCTELVRLNGADVAADLLSLQELTDLMVWFNLAWIGFRGQRRSDVRELIARGRGYSLDDQRQVLNIHRELAAMVLPGYRALAEARRIELSATPFNHPILPLLIDLAGEGTPNYSDPLPEFKYRPDATLQIQRAQAVFAGAFGHAPAGMWPAEGSVSDVALEEFADAGVSWVATDQSNLPQQSQSHLAHLTPWQWSQGDKQVQVFFRDTRLADNIGFEYARWQPMVAGRHLVQMARMLGDQSSLRDPVVTVALDGENPWETYADGGQAFLTALFDAIAGDAGVDCGLPSEIIAGGQHPGLDHIHSGSWIGGNFNIWSRHADTRRAWRLLARARAELDGALGNELVLSHLLTAEGSDWFWWYGDDFISEQAWQFDELFRGHLVAAYAAAGETVPRELYEAITAKVQTTVPRIAALIEPRLDGRVSSFYEWRGAIRVSGESVQGSMARVTHNGAHYLSYGFSADALWLRLELSGDWHADLVGQGGKLRVGLEQGEQEYVAHYELGPAGATLAGDIAAGDIIELRLPLAEVPLERGQTVQLWVECERSDGEACRIPGSGFVAVYLIPDDFAASLWTV
jgi:alpha-amylase/alpha-mannosidase (GH57 family)